MIEIKLHFCYLRPMRIPVFTLILLLIWGCSKVPESSEPVEPLQNVQFEFLQFANNLHFSALVQPTYQGASLDSVSVFWYGLDPQANPDTIKLNDSGDEGDLIAQDDVFTRKISNSASVLTNFIPDSDTGIVHLKFMANYNENIFSDSMSVYLQNIVPQVLSVIAEDTIVRPEGDENVSNFSFVSVAAYDANGLDDIIMVGFTSLHLTDVGPDTLLHGGNSIILYDDGSTIDYCPELVGLQCTSGDIIKDDGVYSYNMVIYGNNSTHPVYRTKTGDFTWTFEVEDSKGDKSVPFVHQVHVK